MSFNIEKTLRDLNKAANECWEAKLSLNSAVKKHAPLCVQVIKDHIQLTGFQPELVDDLLEKRSLETERTSILNAAFWENDEMIIALFKYMESEFNITDKEFKILNRGDYD